MYQLSVIFSLRAIKAIVYCVYFIFFERGFENLIPITLNLKAC